MVSVTLFGLIGITIVITTTAENLYLSKVFTPKRIKLTRTTFPSKKLSGSEVWPDHLNQVSTLNTIVFSDKGYLFLN